jgi:hypothetical protein
MQDLDGASDVLDVGVASGLTSPLLVLVADSPSTLEEVRTALALEG